MCDIYLPIYLYKHTHKPQKWIVLELNPMIIQGAHYSLHMSSTVSGGNTQNMWIPEAMLEDDASLISHHLTQ